MRIWAAAHFQNWKVEPEALGHTRSLAALSEPVTMFRRPHLSSGACVMPSNLFLNEHGTPPIPTLLLLLCMLCFIFWIFLRLSAPSWGSDRAPFLSDLRVGEGGVLQIGC